MVWVAKGLCAEVIAAVPVSPRILRVSIRVRGHTWHVLSAHAPIEAAAPSTKEQFWGTLDAGLLQVGPSSDDATVAFASMRMQKLGL